MGTKKSLLALLLLIGPLFLSSCAAEPKVFVVPAGEPIIEELAEAEAEGPDVSRDISVTSEGIARGDWPSNYENPIFLYHYAELVNSSYSLVYHLDVRATLFYGDGAVWESDVSGPSVEIFPGERILVFKSIFNESDKPVPVSSETEVESIFSRGVTEAEVSTFSVEDLTYREVGAGNFSVSGLVVNRFQREVPTYRVQAWCTDSDGGLHGIEGADARTTVESPLGPGEADSFEFSAAVDSRVQIESCEATVVRFVESQGSQ